MNIRIKFIRLCFHVYLGLGVNQNMEIDNTKTSSKKSMDGSKSDDLINVRAIISCPSCGYKKKFKNQFLRKNLELLTVAVKVFDYITCNKCGDLIKLDLEFNF